MCNLFNKYIILLVVVLFFVDCNKKQNYYWGNYNGEYRYVAAYFDEPIDINWDGIKHTNLYDELPNTNLCNSLYLMLSSADVAKIVLSPKEKNLVTGILDYREPEWWFDEDWHTAYGCYGDIQKSYSVIVEGNMLIPTENSNDWVYQSYPDMQLSEIKSIKIENDTLKIHVLKPFFTSDTIYQTVNAYFHFVKSH